MNYMQGHDNLWNSVKFFDNKVSNLLISTTANYKPTFDIKLYFQEAYEQHCWPLLWNKGKH